MQSVDQSAAGGVIRGEIRTNKHNSQECCEFRIRLLCKRKALPDGVESDSRLSHNKAQGSGSKGLSVPRPPPRGLVAATCSRRTTAFIVRDANTAAMAAALTGHRAAHGVQDHLRRFQGAAGAGEVLLGARSGPYAPGMNAPAMSAAGCVGRGCCIG